MILTYHVTEQSWGKPKLGICWQGKERREKKKRQGGAIRGGGNKKRERERQASFRNRGRVKKRTPVSKTNHIVQYFCIFSFPQRRFPVLSFLLTNVLWQAVFPEVHQEKLKPCSFFPPKTRGFPGNGLLLLSEVRVHSLGTELHF